MPVLFFALLSVGPFALGFLLSPEELTRSDYSGVTTVTLSFIVPLVLVSLFFSEKIERGTSVPSYFSFRASIILGLGAGGTGLAGALFAVQSIYTLIPFVLGVLLLLYELRRGPVHGWRIF